jgi:hypothetical protein
MVAMIRKMKMANKKNTSKPFFNAPKPNPAIQPLNWGQLPAFGLTGPFMVPGQMVPMGQMPPQGFQKGPRPGAHGPKTLPAKPVIFHSIEELIKGKEQFLSLDDATRGAVLRKLLLTKLQKYGSVVDL